MKIDWKLITNVLIALVLMAVLQKLVLNRLLDKIPHFEEFFEAA